MKRGRPSPIIGGVRTRPHAVLGVAAGAHFIHDGFADVPYVLLPVWAAEFGLTLAQVGLIRTCYTGAMAAGQIPVGLLAERWGERGLLAAGTMLTAAAFVASGWAGGFVSLLVLLVVAGGGSGVQHPLASSLVARAWETGARRTALGTYNFSGDLGKVAVPALVGLAAAAVGWRGAAAAAGVVALAGAVAILAALVRIEAGGGGVRAEGGTPGARGGWGIRDAGGFRALAAIGMIDNGTRTALLTFLPFVLIQKGTTVAGVSGALALVFAGGALGKFVCGLIAERLGVIRTVVLTEAATALGILAVLAAPHAVALAVLLPLGVALNGTSSVLYGTVADLVHPARRSRAYGLYYTLAFVASASAPTFYGLLGDARGVPFTIVVIAAVVLLTIPLCAKLRPALALAPDR